MLESVIRADCYSWTIFARPRHLSYIWGFQTPPSLPQMMQIDEKDLFFCGISMRKRKKMSKFAT